MVSSLEPLPALQCPDWSQVRMEDLGSLFSGKSFSTKDGCPLFWAAPVSPSLTDDDEEEEAGLEDFAAAELAEQLAHSMLDEDDEVTEAEEAMSNGASPRTFAAHPLQLLNTNWNMDHLHNHSHSSSSASGSLGSSPTSARTGSSSADWEFLQDMPEVLLPHVDKSSSPLGCPSSPRPPPPRPTTRPHRPAAVATLPLECAAPAAPLPPATPPLPPSSPVTRKAPPCVYVQATNTAAAKEAAANKVAPAGRRGMRGSPVVVDVEMVMQEQQQQQQACREVARVAMEAQAGSAVQGQQQQQPPSTRSSRRSSGRPSRRNKLSSTGALPPHLSQHHRPAPYRVPGLQPLGVWQSGGGVAGLGAVAGGSVTPAGYAGPALPSGLRAVFVHTGGQGGGVREAAGTGTGVFLPRGGVGGEQRAPVGRSGGNSRRTSGSTVLLPSRLVEVLNLSVDHPYASSRPTPITAALHKQMTAGGPHGRRDANGHTGRPPRSPPPTRPPHGKGRPSPFPQPTTMAYVPVTSSSAKCAPKQPETFSGFELPSEWTY